VYNEVCILRVNNQRSNTRVQSPSAPALGLSIGSLDGSPLLVDNFVGNSRRRASFSLVKRPPQAGAKNFSMKKSFPIKDLRCFSLSDFAAPIAHSSSSVFVEFSSKTREKLC
jgi:hypothetical protein